MKMFTIFTALVLRAVLEQDCHVYLADDRGTVVMDAEQRGPSWGCEYMDSLQRYQGSGCLVYKPWSSAGRAKTKPQNMANERIKTY